MSVVLQTNVSSLSAQRHLGKTNRALSSNIAKLSSGFRINSAADDAAGLAISEEMKADIRSLSQAKRNSNDAISMIQTAEGAMGEVHNILGRMRELAVQASSDGINDTQRGHLDTEFQELSAEIDRIAGVTKYNGNDLLDGTLNATFQVGADSGETMSVAIAQDFNTTALGDGTNFIGGADLTNRANADASLGVIDGAISQVSSSRASLGAKQNRLEVTIDNLSVQHENLSAANSRIRDVDVASEMAAMTKNQILMQAGTSMLAQANSRPQSALSLLG
ncbi:flagellin FliC [Persicimonas caeni]|uniref:Flagellin n=1 Tax=Persicimonas caeni TaxID=2292766 RepID=A0A4Y6PT59_PERCE|nr:flagellin [Persicimonas caeni]QDG51319.1 flagellin FliC [Persicimonas caeni]QED32540.1 flagellin FliC [Persicimonas caeni]